jgi:hypothetical protein
MTMTILKKLGYLILLQKSKKKFLEAGKKYFIKIYEQAVDTDDKRMVHFCKCIFECYDLHKINGYIKRPNGKHK